MSHLLKSPAELEAVAHRGYLSELNAAQDRNILDWPTPEEGVYELEMHRLKVVVKLDRATRERSWQVIHERAGVVHSGTSESLEVAKEEAIAYARHYVKNGMVGANS